MILGGQEFCCRHAGINQHPNQLPNFIQLGLFEISAYTKRLQVVHGKAEAKKMQERILEHAAVTVSIKALSSVTVLKFFLELGNS